MTVFNCDIRYKYIIRVLWRGVRALEQSKQRMAAGSARQRCRGCDLRRGGEREGDRTLSDRRQWRQMKQSSLWFPSALLDKTILPIYLRRLAATSKHCGRPPSLDSLLLRRSSSSNSSSSMIWRKDIEWDQKRRRKVVVDRTNSSPICCAREWAYAKNWFLIMERWE